tara:strand:- start:1802 stop:2413 length:612 start_codon:yes stop_codon:yes gene_type:complete
MKNKRTKTSKPYRASSKITRDYDYKDACDVWHTQDQYQEYLISHNDQEEPDEQDYLVAKDNWDTLLAARMNYILSKIATEKQHIYYQCVYVKSMTIADTARLLSCNTTCIHHALYGQRRNNPGDSKKDAWGGGLVNKLRIILEIDDQFKKYHTDMRALDRDDFIEKYMDIETEITQDIIPYHSCMKPMLWKLIRAGIVADKVK